MSALASKLACTGCGQAPPADDPLLFRCPRAHSGDDVDHVLARILELEGTESPFERPPGSEGEEHPFVRFRALLHSYRFALRNGLEDADYVELVKELDREVAEVDGRGFVFTPCQTFPQLAQRLGIRSLVIKDETANVGASHKARHLMGLALQLRVAARLGKREVAESPRLAIASCGNAALAAAIVARAAGWPLEAFVPTHADPRVLRRLEELGARLVRCERRPGIPGDPCAHAFRRATDEGALPFSVQGSENGLAIEGGETLAWELIAQCSAEEHAPPDRVVIQVGGGALGSACVQAFREARDLGAIDALPRFHFVQTSGAWPLHRAWRRLAEELVGAEGSDAQLANRLFEKRDTAEVRGRLEYAARHRSRYMWAWESEPESVATGILDDETYDWHVLVRALVETGGQPLVVDEETLEEAVDAASAHTGIPVGATGAAGLAGLFQLAREGELDARTNAAVFFTGRY